MYLFIAYISKWTAFHWNWEFRSDIHVKI